MLKEWGIDVSEHNGKIDYQQLKRIGCSFVIIRDGLGWGTDKGKDKLMDYHYDAAKTAGMKVGFYHYIWETDEDNINKEFDQVITNIKNKSFEIGLFADIERKEHLMLSSDALAVLCDNWLEECYYKGVAGGIYMSRSYWDKLDMRLMGIKYFIPWIAHWGLKEPFYFDKPFIWQSDVLGLTDDCTLKGQLPGCNGPVDINWRYLNV